MRTTIICVWCNRVMTWGKHDLTYDVCPTCLPAVSEAVLARRSIRHRHLGGFASLLRAVR